MCHCSTLTSGDLTFQIRVATSCPTSSVNWAKFHIKIWWLKTICLYLNPFTPAKLSEAPLVRFVRYGAPVLILYTSLSCSAQLVTYIEIYNYSILRNIKPSSDLFWNIINWFNQNILWIFRLNFVDILKNSELFL